MKYITGYVIYFYVTFVLDCPVLYFNIFYFIVLLFLATASSNTVYVNQRNQPTYFLSHFEPNK